jgi:hypothetical protein
MMKKFLCSVIGCFLIAVAAPAGAADLPLPAPGPVAAPSWTGFHIGAGLGFRSSDTNVNVTSASTTVGALGPFNLITGAGCNAGVPCALGALFNGTSFRFAPILDTIGKLRRAGSSGSKEMSALATRRPPSTEVSIRHQVFSVESQTIPSP